MEDFSDYESYYSELGENAHKSKEDIAFSIKVEICLELLNDPNYEYRKEKTLKKESSMTDSEFEKFLKLHSEVQKSSIPAADNDNLYRVSRFF